MSSSSLLNSSATITRFKEKSKIEQDKTSNLKIINESKLKQYTPENNEQLEQQKYEKVINDMVKEEQPKIEVPVEDMQNLIRVVETQRNTAMTRVAVEQARVKTLLGKLEEQKQTISNQAITIATLTETIKNTESLENDSEK